MIKIFVSLSILLLSLSACENGPIKSSTAIADNSNSSTPNSTNINETDLQNQTLILQGTFVSGVHATSGTVKIYEDKNLNRSLVFENFKTDSGPDLRIYMAEDKVLTNFIQITDKANTSGNYMLPIPANVDLKKQTTVIIWCRSFSVLFGSASLK
ncbi:hypothetical protein EMA8858_00310 [Emticicia aquatica]|uniref:DM13 domain-containing protein n=1 Tax=Emticicia aquatica TaxID=1681835 RepID=A0ABM9AL46_9BACT|nr:DM13 domain-containing protein [Emticicia aquatica]CAH0994202.1 hypothetical protein EMA8858_00310 [Emticicia aquatica]